MLSNWDKVSRVSLDAASAATSVGFSAAKQGTKLGFAITRGIASSVASLTGTAVDHAVFGGSLGAGPALGGVVSTAISAIEALTLAPILLGESIASTTLVAAHSSLSVLQAVFPGSDEASFSLTSFVTLVRREWKEDMNDGTSPENKYGVTETMKALVAWATLQGMTSAWQEQRWFKHLKEIRVNDEVAENRSKARVRKTSRLRVTSDATRPHSIVTADIGEIAASFPGSATPPSRTGDANADLKARLRRLSKLVLAGYGGASLLFFGVPPVPSGVPMPNNAGQLDEERELAFAINSSEAEASGSSNQMSASERKELESKPGGAAYSWWNVLLGKHDKDIVLHYAQSHAVQKPGSSQPAPPPAISPTIGTANTALMPRFWVLTDHSRREVVLVIRGTMSLNELAVDLTCDPAEFTVHHSSRKRSRDKGKGKGKQREQEVEEDQEELDAFDEELEFMPGFFPMDLSTPAPPAEKPTAMPRPVPMPTGANDEEEVYQVHGGMLKMARAMGDRGKPVHAAVRHALRQNKGYSLVICGHSLGAGVAALLAMMWADPHTCLTHRPSGLPSNRQVQAYCFAPPCLVCSQLSKLTLASGLITSFVYSHDIVSRLSLGAVRDLRRAASWLCEAESEARGEGYGGVTGRLLRRKMKSTTGWGTPEDEQWFLSIRKTLEANMHCAELFPPGRVLWAIRDGDLHPSHRLPSSGRRGGKGEEKVRLFDVQKPDEVFNQIVFARDMLSSHMPHQYDRVLHELL